LDYDGPLCAWLFPLADPPPAVGHPCNSSFLINVLTYFGSLCNERVDAQCCTAEAADFFLEIAGELFPGSGIGPFRCVDNHKGRFCQELQPGDLGIRTTVGVIVPVTSGTALKVLDVSPGESQQFTVHNNGCYGYTVIARLENGSGGTLSGPLVSANGLVYVKHFDTVEYGQYSPDRIVTYHAPTSCEANSTDRYRFSVDGNDVTIAFRCNSSPTPTPATTPCASSRMDGDWRIDFSFSTCNCAATNCSNHWDGYDDFAFVSAGSVFTGESLPYGDGRTSTISGVIQQDGSTISGSFSLPGYYPNTCGGAPGPYITGTFSGTFSCDAMSMTFTGTDWWYTSDTCVFACYASTGGAMTGTRTTRGRDRYQAPSAETEAVSDDRPEDLGKRGYDARRMGHP
jgi:hypothetical protein